METCNTMLYPPAQLLGINGILKFSKEILKWKQFSPDKLRLAGITNYFQIRADGGTEAVYSAKCTEDSYVSARLYFRMKGFRKQGSVLYRQPHYGMLWVKIYGNCLKTETQNFWKKCLPPLQRYTKWKKICICHCLRSSSSI